MVLIELKAPGVKLKANHIGQVLTYKALILNNKPNVKNIHCFVYGYEKDTTFSMSNDAKIKKFSELIADLRAQYQEYQKFWRKVERLTISNKYARIAGVCNVAQRTSGTLVL